MCWIKEDDMLMIQYFKSVTNALVPSVMSMNGVIFTIPNAKVEKRHA